MNRLKFLLAAFVVAVLTLGIYSCAKEENKTDSFQSVSPRKALDIPIKSGDVLQFRDYSHLSSYVSDLNDLLTLDEVNFESAIFQPTVFQSVYWKLVNDEFADPKDRYMPFLTDPVMMAIVMNIMN
ncbi:MAG: hypothetical protein IPO92_23340 [Saprospiraceae bacterium]|nr:hypothetical protein [Saprospiraceae bacterium]